MPVTHGTLPLDTKQNFVANIERRYGERLRRLLASRLRRDPRDVADLAQEVFLRLLRIDHHETIRSSEAYLFTIAFHVLHQHTLRRAATPEAVDITALVDEIAAAPESNPERQAETDQRFQHLQRALDALPPKARAALVLHRRDGYTIKEIAQQLGVSAPMVRKYLNKALLHCRQALEPDTVRTLP